MTSEKKETRQPFDPRKAAAEIQKRLKEWCLPNRQLMNRESNAENLDSRRRLALECEIEGILEGQANGVIQHGQPKLADLLHRLIELTLEQGDVGSEELYSALTDCAKAGLSVANQDLSGHNRGQFTSQLS